MFELAVPILQAPTGSLAGPELCAAVTAAGGMGAMGLAWTSPEIARAHVREVRAMLAGTPHRLFQANFVLHFEPRALAAVLEEGVPVVTFSWGDPSAHVDLVRSFNALFGVQVGNAEGARRAIGAGADFIICQGVEAGGHVQSSTPLHVLLPQVLAVAGTTPVVAAGGLADGTDIAQVVEAGASAAMLGTRFVATKESLAHRAYKQHLVAGAETALTLCFDGGWPSAQHRVLRNQTLTEWEAAGCPPSPNRPCEGERVADAAGGAIAMYEDAAPRVGMNGDIEKMCLYAGAGVGKIRDVPAAGELVERLWREAQQ